MLSLEKAGFILNSNKFFLKNWDYYQDVFTDEVLSKQPSYPGKLRLSSGLFTDEVLSVHENMISKQKALS